MLTVVTGVSPVVKYRAALWEETGFSQTQVRTRAPECAFSNTASVLGKGQHADTGCRLHEDSEETRHLPSEEGGLRDPT